MTDPRIAEDELAAAWLLAAGQRRQAAWFRYPTPGGGLPEPPPQDRLEHDATELAALIAEAKAELGLAATKPRR
jgi:hypothetical protein